MRGLLACLRVFGVNHRQRITHQVLNGVASFLAVVAAFARAICCHSDPIPPSTIDLAVAEDVRVFVNNRRAGDLDTAADNAAIHNGMAVNLGAGIDNGVIPDPGMAGNLRAVNDNGPIPDPGLVGHPGIVADPGLRPDISRFGNCRRWPHPSAAVGVDTSRSLDTPRPRISGTARGDNRRAAASPADSHPVGHPFGISGGWERLAAVIAGVEFQNGIRQLKDAT